MAMLNTETPADKAARPAKIRTVDRWRNAYREWQRERDFIAIVACLARLSDRRLAMIGMRRDDLIHHVDRMVDTAEEERNTAAEILELVDKKPVAQRPVSNVPETAEIRSFG